MREAQVLDAVPVAVQPRREAPYYVKALAMAIPALMLGFQISAWIFFLPRLLAGRADFRHFYTAGYMLRTGHAGELYDAEAQKSFQDRLTSPLFKADGDRLVPIVLPFNHPAYEALFFTPLAWLSYKGAYLLFLAVNLAALGLAIYLLRPIFGELAAAWGVLPVAMFVCFIPTGLALMLGQDSLFILLFFSAALLSLRRGNEGYAGALVALTCFKFQIAIPIAILFLCWRRWRFFFAFSATAGALAALSIWITGIQQVKPFVRMLLSLNTGLASDPHGFGLTILPEKMMNLRGLVYVLMGRVNGRSASLLTLALSAAVLFYAARIGGRRSSEQQFAIAIIAASLVSYHMLKYDLVILLLPLALVLNASIGADGRKAAGITILCASLFLAPALAPAYLFVPPLCLFLWTISLYKPTTGEAVENHRKCAPYWS